MYETTLVITLVSIVQLKETQSRFQDSPIMPNFGLQDLISCVFLASNHKFHEATLKR